MRPTLAGCLRLATLLTGLLVATLVRAQTPPAPAPAPSPAPSAPRSPVQAIRNKLSAGDLASAESIAEVWRASHGADGPWLAGYSWLARGALLVGDRAAAARYADSTLAYCAARRAAGADLAKDDELETALGAAIEVRAQLLAMQRGTAAAAAFLSAQLDSLPGPISLRSRVRKRLDLLTLAGRPAPGLAAEQVVRGPAPSLAALRGHPVLLFLYNSDCGDCKASAATLARVRARHAVEGLRLVAVTRPFDDTLPRERALAEIESVWTAVYHDLGDTPVVVSTPSMETYGVSSTPTFVFVDRRGVVRRYVPTRLTEAAFERAIAEIAR